MKPVFLWLATAVTMGSAVANFFAEPAVVLSMTNVALILAIGAVKSE